MGRHSFQARTSVRAVVCALMTCATGAAEAQTWDGCVAYGVPITSRMDLALRDIAQATVVGGQPVIKYNPAVLASFSSRFRQWAYLHECAHHALGHLLQGRIPFAQEQQADCWAIRTLASIDDLDRSDVQEVQAQLASFGPGDWMHLPGGQRAINLVACLSMGGGGPPRREQRCRTEMRAQPYQDFETRVVPRQVPCQHCWPTQYGIRCRDPFDVVPDTQTVPVMRTRLVPETVCD